MRPPRAARAGAAGRAPAAGRRAASRSAPASSPRRTGTWSGSRRCRCRCPRCSSVRIAERTLISPAGCSCCGRLLTVAAWRPATAGARRSLALLAARAAAGDRGHRAHAHRHRAAAARRSGAAAQPAGACSGVGAVLLMYLAMSAGMSTQQLRDDVGAGLAGLGASGCRRVLRPRVVTGADWGTIGRLSLLLALQARCFRHRRARAAAAAAAARRGRRRRARERPAGRPGAGWRALPARRGAGRWLLTPVQARELACWRATATFWCRRWCCRCS